MSPGPYSKPAGSDPNFYTLDCEEPVYRGLYLKNEWDQYGPQRPVAETASPHYCDGDMNTAHLDRVDDVIEPLAGGPPATEQPGDLAVGGVQGVADHQQRSDQ